PAFFDTRALSGKFLHVINTCAAYFPSFVHFDFLQSGKVDWENTLNTHSPAHFADGKGFRGSSALHLNDHAPKKLGTAFGAFLDFVINGNGVPGRKFREFLFGNEFVLYEFD